ncbi:hypothetical protein HDV04_003287 [Boothiomyces sp. JEL0838]|nr:hypothetical protein HDV04_003265 [Boothiomyces sp. JEL0838]KAJ3312266.1 hypothetical protein HDV04_003287 [Boothiomyces sp. JEL0838]
MIGNIEEKKNLKPLPFAYYPPKISINSVKNFVTPFQVPYPLLQQSLIDQILQGKPDDNPYRQIEKPKKREQVKLACTNCRKACKKCSECRPCQRCNSYGIECVDAVREPRKKKRKTERDSERTDFSDLDPELDKIKRDFYQKESFVDTTSYSQFQGFDKQVFFKSLESSFLDIDVPVSLAHPADEKV